MLVVVTAWCAREPVADMQMSADPSSLQTWCCQTSLLLDVCLTSIVPFSSCNHGQLMNYALLHQVQQSVSHSSLRSFKFLKQPLWASMCHWNVSPIKRSCVIFGRTTEVFTTKLLCLMLLEPSFSLSCLALFVCDIITAKKTKPKSKLVARVFALQMTANQSLSLAVAHFHRESGECPPLSQTYGTWSRAAIEEWTGVQSVCLAPDISFYGLSLCNCRSTASNRSHYLALWSIVLPISSIVSARLPVVLCSVSSQSSFLFLKQL